MRILEFDFKTLRNFEKINNDLEKDILSRGDEQNKKTNVKAMMTSWQMAGLLWKSSPGSLLSGILPGTTAPPTGPNTTTKFSSMRRACTKRAKQGVAAWRPCPPAWGGSGAPRQGPGGLEGGKQNLRRTSLWTSLRPAPRISCSPAPQQRSRRMSVILPHASRRMPVILPHAARACPGPRLGSPTPAPAPRTHGSLPTCPPWHIYTYTSL